MSIRINIIVLKALVLISILTLPNAPIFCQVTQEDARLKKQVDLIAGQMISKETPGFAVAVIKDQKIILSRGYGMANVEYHVPMTDSSLLNLGSISKHFTAWSILLLEKQGLVSLNDEIRKYLPELPVLYDKIKISHLIYHTSGLPEYLKLFSLAGIYMRDYRRFEDVYEMLRRMNSLEATPGTRFQYRNTNYALLAEIVKRVSGEDFDQWTGDNLFKPLQMKGTVVADDPNGLIENKAESYWKDGPTFKKAAELGNIPGPTLIYTSVRDMAKWMLNFRNNRIGGPELFNRLCTVTPYKNEESIHYVMGLSIENYRQTEMLGHMGSDGGFVTDLTYCPALELGIVVLGNFATFDPASVRNAILDFLVYGEEVKTKSRSQMEVVLTENSDFPKASTIGNYRIDGSKDVLSLFVDQQKLWGNYMGLGNVRLYGRDQQSATNDAKDIILKILEENEEKVSRIEIDLKGTLLTASRIDQEPAGQTVPSDLAGDYYNDALGTVYTITLSEHGWQLHQRRSVGIHDLYYAGNNTLVCSLGEIRLTLDSNQKVTGFGLWNEYVPLIPFFKLAEM